MRWKRRIAKLEEAVEERELRAAAERLVKEYGGSVEDYLEEARRISTYLKLYGVPCSGGKVDYAPAIRRLAEDEGMDPDEAIREYAAVLQERGWKP